MTETETARAESYFLTNQKLMNIFPEHKEEIQRLMEELVACGCSYCVLTHLRASHPDLKFPPEYPEVLVCG